MRLGAIIAAFLTVGAAIHADEVVPAMAVPAMTVPQFKKAFLALEEQYKVAIELHFLCRDYDAFAGHGPCYRDGKPVNPPPNTVQKGTIRYDPGRFRFLNRCISDPAADIVDEFVFWEKGVTRQYRTFSDGERPHGSISRQLGDSTLADYPDLVLGLPAASVQSVQSLSVNADGMYVASGDHVEGTTRAKYLLVADPRKGLFPVYTEYGVYYSDETDEGKRTGKDRRVLRMVRECLDPFRTAEGLWFPRRMLWRDLTEFRNGHRETNWSEYVVESVDVSPSFTDQGFAFSFPEGTEVQDEISDMRYTLTGDRLSEMTYAYAHGEVDGAVGSLVPSRLDVDRGENSVLGALQAGFLPAAAPASGQALAAAAGPGSKLPDQNAVPQQASREKTLYCSQSPRGMYFLGEWKRHLSVFSVGRVGRPLGPVSVSVSDDWIRVRERADQGNLWDRVFLVEALVESPAERMCRRGTIRITGQADGDYVEVPVTFETVGACRVVPQSILMAGQEGTFPLRVHTGANTELRLLKSELRMDGVELVRAEDVLAKERLVRVALRRNGPNRGYVEGTLVLWLSGLGETKVPCLCLPDPPSSTRK